MSLHLILFETDLPLPSLANDSVPLIGSSGIATAHLAMINMIVTRIGYPNEPLHSCAHAVAKVIGRSLQMVDFQVVQQ